MRWVPKPSQLIRYSVAQHLLQCRRKARMVLPPQTRLGVVVRSVHCRACFTGRFWMCRAQLNGDGIWEPHWPLCVISGDMLTRETQEMCADQSGISRTWAPQHRTLLNFAQPCRIQDCNESTKHSTVPTSAGHQCVGYVCGLMPVVGSYRNKQTVAVTRNVRGELDIALRTRTTAPEG